MFRQILRRADARIDELAGLAPFAACSNKQLEDIVGEMAILDLQPRSATVVADTPLRVVVMSSLQFAAVADHCPSVARRVMGTLAQRLRDVQAA